MKLPITDQFLADVLYPFVEAGENMLDFLLSNKYKRIHILLGAENPIIKKYQKQKSREKFNRLIYHLKKTNCIQVKSLKGVKTMMVTKKGFSKILKASFNLDEKKKRKDGKWAMIAYDIPQHRQKARDLLRSVLQNLGYKMFQQSVWVTPYDVTESTEQLLQAYDLEKYVRIFLIEEL